MTSTGQGNSRAVLRDHAISSCGAGNGPIQEFFGD
jgi:hypothetical protein